MATINGTSGDDLLVALAAGDILNGLEGDDLLIADGIHYTTLNGGPGSDQFYADNGSGNTLDGGEGDDVYTGVNFDSSTFDGGEGNDYASAPVAYYSSLNGGAGDDHLAVGGDNNILNGGAGNDYLEGFDSEQPGTNILIGADGDDVLTAYHGGTLTGGEGSDRFDLIHTGDARFITDFEHNATRGVLQPEDVLNLEVWQTFALGEPLDKSLNALVGQGYLVVGTGENVGGNAALDTVVQFDLDGRAGPAAPQTIVTLLDTTLTTYGADMNNWLT